MANSCFSMTQKSADGVLSEFPENTLFCMFGSAASYGP